MDEKTKLYDVPFVVTQHVETLRPLVMRLYPDSPDFVERVPGPDGVKERLTQRGRDAIPTAQRVALEAYAHMEAIAGDHATPTPHHDLLVALGYDAAKLFGVISAALGGMAEHPDPCLVAWGMKDLLDEMQERSDGEAARQATDFVFDNPADSIEQAAALIERFHGNNGAVHGEVAHV